VAKELVSIILVNRDSGDLVDLVFPSIAKQTYHPLEVVVVDNGSTDDSLARVRRSHPASRIIELGRNTGFSHALNVGIRESAGEYVLSLNFDVVLEPDFVTELVAVLRQRLDVGWVAGAMRKLARDGVLDSIDCNGHYLLPSRYVYGYLPAHPEVSFYDTPREVFGASACGALYRRSMLESLAHDGQVFDEDLFAYFEDVDLDWRAQQRGYKCVFTPAAKGAHMRGGTGLIQRPEVSALLLANRLLVMVKNDDLVDIARDLSPIIRRTLLDLAMHVRRHPRSILLAAARLVRLAPRMLRKRRAIRQARVRAVSPVRAFRLETRFLG
jgi:hypothetical protein